MKSFKLTFLLEDTVSASKRAMGLKAEHGLSIVVERTKPKISILMDTGSSPDVLGHNARILGFNFDKFDAVFLSHGHYDHTGGLMEVLKFSKKEVVGIAHPDAFKPKLAIRPKLRYIGVPFGCYEFGCYAKLILVRNSVKIAENIITTGEIERSTPYEGPRCFWTIEGNVFLDDSMKDDQGLVLNLEDKGLVILSGCAHAGIINTIK